MTFSDSDNDGIVSSADIKQINHYYPFGLNMEGNWNGAQGNNKYQYNEKEWNDDFGLGWNHHDWRFFDVAINRFVTIDPEGETGAQRSWNPYHFSFDNPIRYSDPDGRTPIAPIVLRVIGRYALKRVIRVALATPKPTPAALREAGRIHASTIQRDATTVVPKRFDFPIVEFSKKRHEKPYDDLPKNQEGIDKERKRIKEESHGKPNKEQKEELEKLKTQEKLIKERNKQKRDK